MQSDALQAVREVYDAVGEHGSQAPHGMDLATGRELAVVLGYSPERLAAVPPALLEAFVGAGPLAVLADPKPGQVVVDVGCGAGVDSLLAAQAGARVVALDLSIPMLKRLRRGVAGCTPQARLLALQAAAPRLPVARGCADWVWLNGVANLVPDRPALCAELARVLRPAGHLLIADVFAREPVPEALRALPEAWAWCIAGAGAPGEWERLLRNAGFRGIAIDSAEEFPPFFRGVLRACQQGTADG
ncbi:MAG: methyltransferase domain-containing protein [Deferrisomatales bacterium]|nr:methyltransferase domain-containing protein [Deferrisomatales bacterium]